MEYEHIVHTFQPVFDEHSEILILGTLPSVKSRENQFYYGHKQNRFWKVLAKICEESIPETIEEKKEMLLRNHIAIWDVIESCDIRGSSDSSIRNVVPADIDRILRDSEVEKIFTNGTTAYRLYKKYCQKATGVEAVCLPSTSPANAVWRLEQLTEEWGREIFPFL